MRAVVAAIAALKAAALVLHRQGRDASSSAADLRKQADEAEAHAEDFKRALRDAEDRSQPTPIERPATEDKPSTKQ